MSESPESGSLLKEVDKLPPLLESEKPEMLDSESEPETEGVFFSFFFFARGAGL